MCVLCDRWYLEELVVEGIDRMPDDVVPGDAKDAKKVVVHLYKTKVLVEERDVIMGEIEDRGEGDAC